MRVVHSDRAINGESPGWDGIRRRLYWIDTRRPALYALDTATGASQFWEMPTSYVARIPGRVG